MIGRSIAALFIGIVFVGASAAQGPAQDKGKVRTAVVEFTPGPKAAEMSVEAKRQLQASIAFELYSTKKFKVVDVRNTRSATQANLPAINGSGTAAAAKAGKGLDVAYIVTGTVSDYSPKAADGHGQATVSVRLIEVATGKVKYSGEFSVRSGKPMRSGGDAEMKTFVIKIIIEQMAEVLASYV